MITLHLRPIFAARDIDKPYSFLLRNGFSGQMAKSLLSGTKTNVNLKHLERLCELLWCEPNDLLLWQPVAGAEISEEHPLHPLMKKDWLRPISTRKILAKVPLKKLYDAAEELSKGFNRPLEG